MAIAKNISGSPSIFITTNSLNKTKPHVILFSLKYVNLEHMGAMTLFNNVSHVLCNEIVEVDDQFSREHFSFPF